MTRTFGVCLAIAVAGIASVHTQRAPAGPPPGSLVDVGSHKLHIRCVGPSGGPTAILDAGAGNFSTVWSAVQDLLAPRLRSCAYDRAGSGWSEPGPLPRTAKQEAFELHALLEAAKISGAVILVGHSYGAIIARRYVDRYGEDVAGVVLVDPAHENGRFGQMRPGDKEARLVRLREQASRAVPEPRRLIGGVDGVFLAEDLQELFVARQSHPQPLGARPLLVIIGTRPEPVPPGVDESVWRDFRRETEELKADLPQLSSNSKVVRDPSSGHEVHTDNPRVVAQAIEEVSNAAQTRARLVP